MDDDGEAVQGDRVVPVAVAPRRHVHQQRVERTCVQVGDEGCLVALHEGEAGLRVRRRIRLGHEIAERGGAAAEPNRQQLGGGGSRERGRWGWRGAAADGSQRQTAPQPEGEPLHGSTTSAIRPNTVQ